MQYTIKRDEFIKLIRLRVYDQIRDYEIENTYEAIGDFICRLNQFITIFDDKKCYLEKHRYFNLSELILYLNGLNMKQILMVLKFAANVQNFYNVLNNYNNLKDLESGVWLGKTISNSGFNYIWRKYSKNDTYEKAFIKSRVYIMDEMISYTKTNDDTALEKLLSYTGDHKVKFEKPEIIWT